jgi:cystathionine gamma-synthase
MAEFETRAIHTGLSFREETGAVIPPPWLTSTFAAGNAGGFDYTRSGNPSFRNLAETLASLEQARYATVFASGVSAITAVVSGLRHGDTVAAEENLYGCTFRLFEQVFRKFGLNVFYEDFTRDQALERVRREKPALVWIESPTNPMLKIIDIARTAEAARASGSCLIVDNTFASSYLQQPLRLGAHLSLLSTTKYTGGHSDVLGGAVCTDDPQQHERLEFAQKALGLQPSPFDCWMLSRGVKTEALRMERHCSNALAFARFLEEGTPARWVRYPFLPSHPQQSLARRQMRGGSGENARVFGKAQIIHARGESWRDRVSGLSSGDNDPRVDSSRASRGSGNHGFVGAVLGRDRA